ncbi:MAG TPA: BatD family protein, partial [Fibrobacteraceae bacterium]|nr:BatD family protein [Fibrobacteraceae bacterium]
MMKKTLLYMLLASAMAFASFGVDFDKDRIEAGKPFQMILSIPVQELPESHGVPKINDLHGFELKSIDSVDERQVDFFTGRQMVRRYKYNLIAPAQGGSYLFALTWEMNGTDRSLGNVKVNVARPYDASALAVILSPSKRTVYEGEQLNLTMSLLTYDNFQGGLNLSGIDLGNDFVAHRGDLGQLKFNRSKKPGVQMEASARIAWLCPIRSGDLEIPELKFKYQKVGEPKVVNKQMGNFSFSSVTQQPEEATATSARLKIHVLPLPEEGRPADFSGMVGQYSFDAKLDRTNLQVGEALTLTLKIRGNGKPGAIPDPKLPDFSDFRSVPPEGQVTKSVVDGVLWTERTLQVFLYPKKKGEFHLEPIRFSWFDPTKRKYMEASSQAFVVQVEKGDITQAAAAGGATYTPANPGVDKKDIEQLGNDIRFIHEPANVVDQGKAWYKSPLFWLLFIAPFVLVALFSIGWRRHLARMEDSGYRRSLHAEERLHEAWNQADQADPKTRLASIEQTLLGYLGDLHNIDLGGLT